MGTFHSVLAGLWWKRGSFGAGVVVEEAAEESSLLPKLRRQEF